MSTDSDADLQLRLDALEQKVDDRRSPKELASETRDLVEDVPEGSPLRPRALRLRGIVLNRLKDPKRALAHLHQARQIAISHDNVAEVVNAGREIAVVHAWRGEDRHAALALLHTVAISYLANDPATVAFALGEAGRIELEAQRFEDAARLLRLVANQQPQHLPPRELVRVRINLCQAMNRLGVHAEVLKHTATLLADLAGHTLERKQRLVFLTLLEETRAYAGLRDFEAAAASLARARELLPEDQNEFDHDEAKEAEAEIKLARQDRTAIEDLKRLAKRYTDPSLTVRAANLRIMGARDLFETGHAADASQLLAEALRDAVKAGLPDIAQRIRKEMLEGDGARHLDAMLKQGAVEAIGGEWSVERQLIRLEALGEGGGGKVYRAIDLRDGQEVAVKEVSFAAHSKDKRRQIIETVRNEYAVAVALPDSPNIAKVRGLLNDPSGTLFIVQEFIKGTSLAKLYAPEPQPAKLLPLLIDVTDALADLHASHIVHRDLKPDNVMIRKARPRDQAVLIDFGIAFVDGQEDTLKRYGTPRYIAPEQAKGDKVDGSADVYALGQMIAEIWAGEGPSGKIPKPLAALVEQMLARDPRKRPSLDTVRAALAANCPSPKI